MWRYTGIENKRKCIRYSIQWWKHMMNISIEWNEKLSAKLQKYTWHSTCQTRKLATKKKKRLTEEGSNFSFYLICSYFFTFSKWQTTEQTLYLCATVKEIKPPYRIYSTRKSDFHKEEVKFVFFRVFLIFDTYTEMMVHKCSHTCLVHFHIHTYVHTEKKKKNE